MIESSSSSPKNTQKEDGTTKNTPKSVDCIELLEDDENESVGVVAEDIQRIEEENEGEEEKEENEEREGEEEEEDDIKVIEEKPPAPKRPKIATTGQRRNSEWPRDGSSSPVPEDPREAKDVCF